MTRGELRKLSQEGKITAKVMLDAFGAKYANEIDQSFAKTKATIGDGMTELRNEMLVTVGKLAEDVDLVSSAKFVFETVAGAAKMLADVLRLVAAIVKPIVQGLAALWDAAKNGSPAAIAALVAIGALIGTITGGVGLFVAALVVVARHWDEIKEAMLSTWDATVEAASEAWQAIKDGFTAAFAAIAELPVIKQLIWLVEHLDRLTSLGGAVMTPDQIAAQMANRPANAANVVPTQPGTVVGPSTFGSTNITINGVKDADRVVPEIEGAARRVMEMQARHAAAAVGGM